MEQPSHCIDSVLEIRRFLTNELAKLDPNEPLAQNLQAMRAACRKFLDQLERFQAFDQVRYRRFSSGYIQNMGTYEVWVFCSALGDLRTSVGLHVALIAVRNGLDVEEDLASILPGEFDDGGAIDLNLF